MSHVITRRCLDSLSSWSRASERWWVDLPATPGGPTVGFYGTGYNQWGVQTNQKYLAAMAILGRHGDDPVAADRALAALRFSLRTHHAAQDQPDALRCMDGSAWGCTWISPLGIERMMFGVQAMKGLLTDEDQAALKRMLIAEADWQHDHHERGSHRGILADRWGHSGKNNPESNIWTGALLWRTATMYPDHPRAAAWRTRAEAFLLNGVSTADDAGHPLYVGDNFFPHYGLDHHGYFNVGYMVICVSNVAFLHFDLKAAGAAAGPQHLHHRQAALWQALRPMIFDDGRLARLGGDSRLRYTYCQEYLLPSLMYAADHLGDTTALPLVDRQLDLIDKEQRASGDGSYYGQRLQAMADTAPYYYTRLESDRACMVACAAAYAPMVTPSQPASTQDDGPVVIYADWCEPEHGSVLHRSEKRLASWAWRAHGLTQGLCLPPDRGDLAEWACNLAGRVRFVGDAGPFTGGQTTHRRLGDYRITPFPGGFITIGHVIEGMNLVIPEGLRMDEVATHHLCFAALPDGQSVVGMQLCVMRDKRAHAHEIKGLLLNIPNDVYNDRRRTVTTRHGQTHWQSPPDKNETISLDSPWACIDDTLGVIGLYGATSLTVDRSTQRRAGHHQSLHVEELCWHHQNRLSVHNPGQVILNVGWRVVASVNGDTTAQLARRDDEPVQPSQSDGLKRQITVVGCDGKRYQVTADFESLTADVQTL